MPAFSRNRNFWLVPVVDALILIAAHGLSYLVRFEPDLSAAHWENIKIVLPWFVPLQLGILYYFGLYRDSWPGFGPVDILDVFKATLLSLAAAAIVLLFYNYFQGFSRGVFLLDGLFTFVLICGHRLFLRVLHKGLGPAGHSSPRHAAPKKNILILGAGDAGKQVVREVQDNPGLPYRVQGFLDDDTGKIGRRISGIPVLDATRNLAEAIQHTQAREVWIATASALQEQKARWAQICSYSGLPCKTLPGPEEMDNHQGMVSLVRDLSYKDLLPRPGVRLDKDEIQSMVQGKTILITGAGGAVGSQLAWELLGFDPGLLVLMDHRERYLHEIESEILHQHGFDKYSTLLGEIQDQALIKSVFEQYKPDVVLHAATYWQVSVLERNPWEAVHNNVLASRKLMRTAREHGTGRFVLLSRDQAARPENIVDASMKLAEMIMLGQEGPTRFMAVRLENVLGTWDAIISRFKEEIEKGGPVTAFHPELTRHFISGEEAARLTLQAGAMGEGGEIFILQKGTRVRISDLVRNYIRLCGKEPGTEIEIKYTGLRPGEKLYEEFITQEEGVIATRHENIMVLNSQCADINTLRPGLDKIKKYAARHDAAGIRAELQRMIPEYVPADAEVVLEPVANRDDLDDEADEAGKRQGRVLFLRDKSRR